MFRGLLERVKQEVVTIMTRVQFQPETAPESVMPQRKEPPPEQLDFRHEEVSALQEGDAGGEANASTPTERPYVRETPKVGRNEPCPCGSGKKYKQCHGKLA